MPTKSILVVGGAGYIGSHMVHCLHQAGFQSVVLDNLSKGHRDAVSNAKLIEGDMADPVLLDHLFSCEKFLAVMHFASFTEVGESIRHPSSFYKNNVAGTLNLLNAMLKWNVNKFIFSSSAAVYGEPRYTPIDENHPKEPINPYGRSKQMIEQVLEDFSKAYDFQFAALRYFNAAGADPDGRFREKHYPETHLIPLILQVVRKELAHMTVYGRDYPTMDGTCIRDYIHVSDLCDAHLSTLYALLEGKRRAIYNLGTGQGYSVKEVIEMAKRVTESDIPMVYADRRSGDPAVLVADPKRAMRELQWQPKYADLNIIIEHAWKSEN